MFFYAIDLFFSFLFLVSLFLSQTLLLYVLFSKFLCFLPSFLCYLCNKFSDQVWLSRSAKLPSVLDFASDESITYTVSFSHTQPALPQVLSLCMMMRRRSLHNPSVHHPNNMISILLESYSLWLHVYIVSE